MCGKKRALPFIITIDLSIFKPDHCNVLAMLLFFFHCLP